MTSFLTDIKKKIIQEIQLEDILLIDNSSLHSKHKSFSKDKFHIKIIIKSKKLKRFLRFQMSNLFFFRIS